MIIPKLVIIDDEHLNADGIKMLIEKSDLNVEISGVFYSSVKALQFIKGHPADIVLTDIKMPQISGLDLIARIKEANIDAETIIFTGFGSLVYAQEAMKYGVKYFLEKPISTDKLKDSISDCVDDWLTKRREKRLRIKQLIENTILGEVNNVELTSSFDVVMMKERDYREVMKTGLELPDDKYIRILIEDCVLYCCFDNGQIDWLIAQIKQLVRGRACVVCYQRKLFINTIPISFSCGKQLLNLDFYCEQPTLIEINSSNNKKGTGETEQLLSELEVSLVNDNYVAAESLLKEVIKTGFKTQYGSKQFKNRLEQLSEKVLQMHEVNSSVIDKFQMEIEKADFAFELANLINKFTKVIEKHGVPNDKRNDITVQLNKIINTRYHENTLSLKWISNNILYLNPEYMGKKYLKETGKKFTTVLLEIRMNKAAQLLKKGHSISETADAVGYTTNQDYFSQQFKHYWDITPRQYQKDFTKKAD
ncbi:response regulator transcription factor [Lapidilactobacillus bayanensis]|uniref:response regulator transcription factor n=1 Tax=Lapidilactobacillus bayanensis TaxID=2485998 RepID=UPI000F779A01|nr:response regulator [Lapidilactobacillus bayanensis]